MEHRRAGDDRAARGNPDWFTGEVWLEPVVSAPEPARIRGAKVSFSPGGRTAWHTHPLGQTLYVLTGIGRFQTWGKKIQEIQPGDAIWIPPGEKHWHGAAPDCPMVHLAFQESLDGKHIDWLEQVSEADYTAPAEG